MDISKITVNFHSSIRIDAGKIIYIDPFKISNVANDAAKLVNKIKPKVAIPVHYGGIIGTISDADKSTVQADIDKIKAILDRTTAESMTDADVDELKAAKETLMQNAQQVFAKVYEQAQAAGAGAGAAGPDMSGAAGAASDNGGDDVVDGDYREI